MAEEVINEEESVSEPQIHSSNSEMQKLLDAAKASGMLDKATQESKKSQIPEVDPRKEEKVVSDLSDKLEEFFESEIIYQDIEEGVFVFKVKTLDADTFLSGDLPIIDPNNLDESTVDYMKFLSSLFRYFVRSLVSIRNTKTKSTIIPTDLVSGKFVEGTAEYYVELTKVLGKKISVSTLSNVVSKYGTFFIQTQSDVLEKKSS